MGDILPYWFIVFSLFLFGATIGSFLNVCIYRIPLNRSIVYPPSRCRCKTNILFRDNIPLLGYFLLKGRCRFCGYPISIRYPLVEFISASFAVGVFFKYGISWMALFFFLFLATMLIVALIDIDHQIIPNSISITGIGIAFGMAYVFELGDIPWFVSVQESFFGIIAGGGILWGVSLFYRTLTGRDGIGFGDVKLLAMLGGFFGWEVVLITIFFSSLLGSVVGLSLMVLFKKSSKYPIPFGPFIIAGNLISVWLGNPIMSILFGSERVLF